MAIDPATICHEIECNCRHGFNNETFKSYVLQLLCAMSTNISAFSDPEPLPETDITFSAITTSYPGVGQIDVSPGYYRSVTVGNSTNQPVLMSVDGNLTILTTPAGETRTVAVLRASQLFFKSAVAPTSGTVRVSGY